MATSQRPLVIQYLRRTLRPPDAEGVADAELLERFVGQRDEAAFELLVWRHGGMVLSLCRRILHDAHEAEDAFQATFLALARKAGSIGRRESLSSWLHKVAYRMALTARAAAAKRTAREQPLFDLPATAPDFDPSRVAAGRELCRLLDAAVNRLPAKQRAPFVLCHLEGKTNEQAAQQLGCPLGTVLSRLARARERLRRQLARQGVVLTGGAFALALVENTAAAAVSPALVGSITKAVTLVTAGQAAAAGVLSAKVAALTEGVLKAMFLTKLKIATAVLVTAGVIGAGTGGYTYHMAAAAGQDAGQGTLAQTAESLKPVQSRPDPAPDDSKARLIYSGELSSQISYPQEQTQDDLEKLLKQLLEEYQKNTAEDAWRHSAVQRPFDLETTLQFQSAEELSRYLDLQRYAYKAADDQAQLLSRLSQLHQKAAKQDVEGKKAQAVLQQIQELLAKAAAQHDRKAMSYLRLHQQITKMERPITAEQRDELLTQLLRLQEQVVRQTNDEKEKRLQDLLKQLEAHVTAEQTRTLAKWRSVQTARKDIEKAVQMLQPADEANLLKALDEIEQAVKRIRGTIQTKPPELEPRRP
jgi:RNA polymerase sigma factor (sigma-70 family)